MSKTKSVFKKCLSLIMSMMLIFTSFTLSGFVPAIEAEAATNKVVMHFDFNGSLSDVVNGGSLTVTGWTENNNTGEQRSDHWYHRDGGVYGSIAGLNGKNNWILTYKGYSYGSSDDANSCEIGLGTAVDNTDVLRVTRNGILYVANENKGTMSLNVGDASNTYNSSKINTIIFDYFRGNLKVTVNGNVFGSYAVESSVFSNVRSLYTGLNAARNVGNRYHFVDDIVATTVDDTCVTKADFETAFTNFENKINNTKLYTNIKPAYDAYINARKVYDAYYYGNDITLTNISDAFLELQKQTEKLTNEWQSPTGTAVPYFNAGTVQTSAYSNLLYSKKVDGHQNFEQRHSYGSDCIICHRIANNQTVMMYDGNTIPKMPVIYNTIIEKTKNGGSKNRSPYMVYPTTGEGKTDDLGALYLLDKWKGYTYSGNQTDNSLYNFETIYSKTNNYVGHNSETMHEGKNMERGYWNGYSDYFAYANVLAYSDSNSFVNDDSGDYSKKFKLYWCFRSEVTGKSNISDLKSTTGYQAGNDNAAIYVVNYKPLRDKIVNAKNKIPNKLTNVKQGGLTEYLSYLDDIMAFNPNNSFSNISSITDGINKFNSAMATNMTKASNMENATIPTDNSAYDTIRDEIDMYKAIKNEVDNGLRYYSSTSLNAYITAYNYAKAVMADVDNNGYKSASDTTPNNKAQALKKARENLQEVYKVTFKNNAGVVVETREIIPGSTLGKLPENTTTVKHTNDKKHTVYSWPAGVSESTVIRGSGEYNEIATTESCVGTPTKTEIQDSKKGTLQVHKTTCSVCSAEYTELHNLELNGNTAKCSECDYTTEEDGYNFNGFRITKGNLFDFDKYAENVNSTQIIDNKGTTVINTTNDSITVIGNDVDAYTRHAASPDYYRIPVTPNTNYIFSYVPSTGDNQAYVFFSDGNSYFPTSGYWCINKYGAEPNQEWKIKFITPENCTYVDFRFGTVNSGAICTFSDISFYECDENGNPTNGYKVLASGLTSGANVLESLNIPSADRCNASYDMSNKSGKISTSDFIDTNLNISLDTEHVYGDFTNDYTTDLAYNENTTYTHSKTCSDCSYKLSENCSFINQGINGDKAIVQCSECGGNYTLDCTAYNAALTEAENELKNTAKYTDDSLKALQQEINKYQLDATTYTQSSVDAKADAIQEANKLQTEGGKLVLREYQVSFYVVDEATDEQQKIELKKPTYQYGEVAVCTAPEGISPYKWTIDDQGSRLANATNEVSIVVTDKTTVYAWYSKKSTAPEKTQHKITVLNKYNKAVSYIYVDDSTNITLSGSTISYNSSSYTIDKLPFYQITGYTINNQAVSGEYMVTSDIVIKPVYTASETIDIKLGTESIKFKDDEALRTKTAQWDDKITVVADSEMTWYVDDVPVAKGNTYTFRVSKSVTVTAKPFEQATETPKSIVNYAQFDNENKKAIITVSNYQSENYQIAEQGIIFGTSKNVNAQFDKKLIIDKGKKYVASKTTDTGDQFSFSLSFDENTTVRTLCIVSYVKYVGQSEPVYSDKVTYVAIN